MWYDLSQTISPAVTASVSLQRLYTVKADASYDHSPNQPLSSPHVAVRTWAGEGILQTDRREPFYLKADTLLLVPCHKIKRFRCEGGRWDFWWFEFRSTGNLPIPTHELQLISDARKELRGVQACFDLLRENAPAKVAMASARFSLLLYDWASRSEVQESPQLRHHDAIHRVVQAMNSDLAAKLSLPQMARLANLSQRRFRQIFTLIMGKAPKKFHEELRLRMAAEHLRFNMLSISQIADALGYSSPFHLSKSFRKHFGVPPSRYLISRNLDS